MFSKTQDQAIDNLLRAGKAEQPGPHQVCQEFDPDLANTYIEHAMAPAERARYERHLSICTPCRRDVIALARLARAESPATPARVAAPAIARRPRLATLFGQMRAPQWAMATAAVLLIALAVPVLMSWRGAKSDLAQNAAGEPGDAAAPAPPQPNAAARLAATQQGSDAPASAPAIAMTGGQQPSPDQSQPLRKAIETTEASRDVQPDQAGAAAADTLAKADVAERGTQFAATQAAPTPVTEPAASRADTQTQSGLQSQTASPQQAVETPLPQISREQVARIPETNKDAAKVTTLRPGRADGDGRAGKDETIRSNSGFTPPSEAEGKLKARGSLAEQPGAMAIADPRRAERDAAKRSEERKSNGKTFWLRDGVWTDKKYDPAKKRATVEVSRDSETFRAMTAKYPDLTKYLSRFAANDRVIVVYKDVVYKINP